ncbi:MAG: hypothetical protein WA418_16365 [Bradyrhizobium sp.]
MSYFSCSKRRNDDVAPEKFRQRSAATHIAMDTEPAIAFESVANAHTAADLHVRPVSKTALVLKIVGAASGFKKYTMRWDSQSI